MIALEGIVSGADVAIVPAIAIVPGEVVGQHFALDARLAWGHRRGQGHRFGRGCGGQRGGRGRWGLHRQIGGVTTVRDQFAENPTSIAAEFHRQPVTGLVAANDGQHLALPQLGKDFVLCARPAA